MMVIPVCFKCESPIRILSIPQNGIETIRYQCIECKHTSASFLLGYVESAVPDETKPEDDTSQRAQLFSQAAENYRLRAKMQGLVDLKNDGLRPNISPESSPDAP